jgi:outer membrane lipoprotein-sorting protein
VPAVVVPAVIVVGAVIAPLQASAVIVLPEKTPEELLEFASSSEVRALSGTIEQNSRLGLPDLSGVTGSPGGSEGADIASTLELVTGSHTARVYLNGPTNARIQVLDQLAERNIVRSGGDVWFYDSEDRTASHATLPAGAEAPRVQTPERLADRFLASIDQTTEVTVGTNAQVAGRPAYQLVLTPLDDDTLVASVTIAIDSETGLAVGVEILASGGTAPAFALAFTELSLATPDAGLFAFTPPPGTTVTELTEAETREEPTDRPGKSSHSVSGEGWSSILEIPASEVPSEFAASPLLASASQEVSGGRLLSTALVNVLVTDDGRLLLGSVTADRLQDAAAGL